MQVSHETMYRTLFIQSRGALRKELTQHLRTGRVIDAQPAPGVVSDADLGPAPRDGRASHVHSGDRIEVSFCDPKSPRQRASNENTNGFLGQYLPRTLDFKTLTQADFDAIADEL